MVAHGMTLEPVRPRAFRALAERLVTDFASHIYFPAEFELLFLSAGFEIARQSPAGDWIAFVVARDWRSSIWLIRPDPVISSRGRED